MFHGDLLCFLVVLLSRLYERRYVFFLLVDFRGVRFVLLLYFDFIVTLPHKLRLLKFARSPPLSRYVKFGMKRVLADSDVERKRVKFMRKITGPSIRKSSSQRIYNDTRPAVFVPGGREGVLTVWAESSDIVTMKNEDGKPDLLMSSGHWADIERRVLEKYGRVVDANTLRMTWTDASTGERKVDSIVDGIIGNRFADVKLTSRDATKRFDDGVWSMLKTSMSQYRFLYKSQGLYVLVKYVMPSRKRKGMSLYSVSFIEARKCVNYIN